MILLGISFSTIYNILTSKNGTILEHPKKISVFHLKKKVEYINCVVDLLILAYLRIRLWVVLDHGAILKSRSGKIMMYKLLGFHIVSIDNMRLLFMP